MNFRPQVDLIDMQSHADRENKAFLYIKIILQNLCSFNQLHLSVNCLPINYGTYLVYLKLQAHPVLFEEPSLIASNQQIYDICKWIILVKKRYCEM